MRSLFPLLPALATAASACFGGFEPQRAAPTTRPARPARAATKAAPPSQTYEEAWSIICHAEQRSGHSTSNVTRAERGARVAAWIVEHLKNEQARYWFIGFGKVKDDRAGVFSREARRAGVRECPLVELLFGPSSQPTRPSSQPAGPRSQP